MRKITFAITAIIQANYMFASSADLDQVLNRKYQQQCTRYSDIVDHLPTLRRLSSQSASVVEIGLRSMVSTWGLLKGLSESPAWLRSYVGIDIARPPEDSLILAEQVCVGHGIQFQFWQVNDMAVMIPECDLLFIDSLHTYVHLTYELETFSPRVRQFIAMHDTSAPWGEQDEIDYGGNYSAYPSFIDRTKHGLWQAVMDFLERHSEWHLAERYYTSHGFTVLQRKAQLDTVLPE